MSDRIGNMRQEFERNFERTSVENVSQTDNGGDDKNVKGAGKKGADKVVHHDGVTSTSNVPVQVEVMQFMLAAYNANTTDIEAKGKLMENTTAIGQDISNADAAIELAALANGGGVNGIDVVPNNSSMADTNVGGTAYITQQQYDELKENGLTIPTGQKLDTTSLSALTSQINNIQETLNGNTEYTMLQLQTDTQNQQQDSSMASGTLKSIGDSIAGVARNVGG